MLGNKLLILMAIIFILTSCFKPEVYRLKPGVYASQYPNRIISRLKWYLFKNSSTIGDTLTLNKDKSFTKSSCGNIAYGFYKIEKDKLLLKVDSNYFRSRDSMQYVKYTDTFYILDKFTLKQDIKAKFTRESKETFDSYTKLHFVKEK
jgi:hypothetical protein